MRVMLFLISSAGLVDWPIIGRFFVFFLLLLGVKD